MTLPLTGLSGRRLPLLVAVAIGLFWSAPALPPSAIAATVMDTVPAPLAAEDAVTLGASFDDVPATLLPTEMQLLNLINRDRIAQGVAPLALDTQLMDAARIRARDQIPLPALSHYDAAGQVVIRRLFAQAGAAYLLGGENLARVVGADGSSAQRAHDALMRSPGHRANILEPRYTMAAVAAAVDGHDRVIYAELFREPADE